MNQKGSFYIEMMIATTLMGIVAVGLLPLFPRLIQNSQTLTQQTKLISVSEYVSEYIYRWTDFSATSKLVPLDYYSDGQELELSGEKRVNRLLWAEPLKTKGTYFSDHYKTSIIFQETSRVGSALINVVVWYDKNLDNAFNPEELSVKFSLIATEKQAI